MSEQVSFSRLVSERATTVTTRRMDTIIGRAYSLALISSVPEVLTNSLEQRHLLNPVPFWILLALNLASIFGMAIGNWLFEVKNFWYIFHAGVVVLGLALWPLLAADVAQLPHGFTPFIWWTMGWGCLSAGLGLNRIFAALYLVITPAWFAAEQFMPMGGGATLGVALQNAIYTVLISAVLVTLVALLRWRALQQDIAAEAVAQTQAESAASDAVLRERTRVGSVVHTQVLTALNAALEATTAKDRATAAALATSAIDRLANYDNEAAWVDRDVAVDAFFETLSQLVRRQSAEIGVSVSVEGAFEVPLDVAAALTEATLQAVNNSILHSGPATSNRRVSLKATGGHVKVTVVDDGTGFRPSRIPKNRLGIRTIIFKRTQQAGIEAHIKSAPGEGTTVILEWQVGRDD